MPLRLFPLLLALVLQAAAKPSLFIIGDSTVRNNTTPNQRGWGDPLATHFDAEKIHVHNHAIGGRSSRSFLTEGRWAAVVDALQPGDFVLIQFGHNDGGEMFTGNRPRASIKGNGDESRTGVVEATGSEETVLSYGAYLRTYCEQALAKGATPIVLSLIPRNIWREGKIGRATNDYGRWAREAALQAGAHFIDFNSLLADRYEQLGAERTAEFFNAGDHTHTNDAGAAFNAAALADALRELDCPLRDHLLPKDR
jgi:lysophospholipase L1-like esterase